MSGAPVMRRMKQRLQGTQSSQAPVQTGSELLLNASSLWPLFASASVHRRAGAARALKGFPALWKLIGSAPKAWPAPRVCPRMGTLSRGVHLLPRWSYRL